MEKPFEDIEFNRSKIFERLEVLPEPKDYKGRIPWVVQNQIAATNGTHYIDSIGKLSDYPVYELPVEDSLNSGLMLDIGCGWGRWLIAAANKGYLPVGLDLRLEFCETSRRVMQDLHKPGYVVVGDLENLPFIDSIFDLVWSFSVIQHTHHFRMRNCLKGISEILTSRGFTLLEFPNKNGIRNRSGAVQRNTTEADNYNSWAVRYYTVDEYREILGDYLSGLNITVHSFLGIGVLKEDLKYVSFKNKILCSGSLLLTSLTHIVPSLYLLADSLYFKGYRKTPAISAETKVETFRRKHLSNSSDNLNIVSLLKCPKYGGMLEVSSDRKRLVSKQAGIYYPVMNDIPILISSEAVSLA